MLNTCEYTLACLPACLTACMVACLPAGLYIICTYNRTAVYEDQPNCPKTDVRDWQCKTVRLRSNWDASSRLGKPSFNLLIENYKHMLDYPRAAYSLHCHRLRFAGLRWAGWKVALCVFHLSCTTPVPCTILKMQVHREPV